MRRKRKGDPTDKMPVNDIDVRVKHVLTSVVYYPWRLDGANPADAAARGDNVEAADINNAMIGVYVVTVTHKGSLSGGRQEYSIVCTEDLSLTPMEIPTLSQWDLMCLLTSLAAAGIVLIYWRRAGVL